MVGQRAIHRGAGDTKPVRDLGRAQLLLDTEALHFGRID